MKSTVGGARWRRIFLTLAFVLGWGIGIPVWAGEASVLFVLDGSGSMWGRVEGRPKIEVAREALATVLTDLPAYVDVGLVAYGHRSKEDCEDIALVAPLGEKSASELKTVIRGVEPRGQTPLSRSLLVAFDEVATRPGMVHVVLISDGEETCGGDPCALMSDLRSAGSRVNYHVIGFDVSDKEGAQLRCVAEAGRGEYHSATDLDSLTGALGQVRRKVLEALPQ
ncbi:MAG: VWA domain-containing protein [Thermoanaerobaculia bacterium]|nr:VWA domain-containing protein [Thermoanaerobaculia bacterium]